MFLADTLSRAFLLASKQDENEYLLMLEETLLIIQQDTEADESLQVLKTVIQRGWPEHSSNVPSIISTYFNMPNEMSIQDGLIFKGERVVVPWDG